MNLSIHTVDLLVLVLYLHGVVALGMWFGKGQKDLTSYLLGDRDLPWWAILGSIVATETSTVTFLSVPGIAYAAQGDLTFLQLTFGYIIGRVLITILLMPGYFEGNLFTAYEILEHRFGTATKRSASIIFLVARNFGDALRLFLTAVVLQTMFEVSLPVSITIIGALTVIYTLFGGMKAVVWNDCLQLVVYLAGGVLVAAIILQRLPNGWDSVVEFGRPLDRFRVFDFSFDVTKPYTFWAGLVGGLFLTLGTHGVDQMLVQRYLAARSRAHASTALIVSGFVVCIQFSFFLWLGVALAAYTSHQGTVPVASDRALANFIVHDLPRGVGIIGFILAGVFAAAMSTLSSSLNSSATVVVNDFMNHDATDSSVLLRRSRVLTAVFGLIQILIAIAASYVSRSVVSEVLGIAGMTVGLLLGLFGLGKMSRRAGESNAIFGLLCGAALLLFIKFDTSIAWPWYALIGSASTIVFALLFDAVIRKR